MKGAKSIFPIHKTFYFVAIDGVKVNFSKRYYFVAMEGLKSVFLIHKTFYFVAMEGVEINFSNS